MSPSEASGVNDRQESLLENPPSTSYSSPPATPLILGLWNISHGAIIAIVIATYACGVYYIKLNPYELTTAYEYYNDIKGFTGADGVPTAKYWSSLMKLSAVWMTFFISLLYTCGRWVIKYRSTEMVLSAFFGVILMTISSCILMCLIFGVFTIRSFFGWNIDDKLTSEMLRWGIDNHNMRIASSSYGYMFLSIAAIYCYFASQLYKFRGGLIDYEIVETFDWAFLEEKEEKDINNSSKCMRCFAVS
mmetsp:Transcript_16818/g.37840  ORF Transcript_16818/g.37840 Transcript_16818/m.37840 type:complete len:247 (-) Transcript_16818:303-1043(-)